MKRIVLMMLWVVTCLATAGTAHRPLWMRYPAISPDGTTIVFAYKGDLYRIAATCGTAVPMTLGPHHDSMPVWSHDGKWIAFASDRYGNDDVFIMPAAGGAARRLTYHAAPDHPTDFTPDNSGVIFSSSRTDAPDSRLFPTRRLPELYAVPVRGGRPVQLLTIPAERARFFRDGTRLVYYDKTGIEDPWRKHHRSSVTRDIWTVNLEEHHFQRLTRNPAEDRDPVLSPDESTVYFLSERNGSFNIFRMPVGGGSATQLTRFHTHPIRFLSISGTGTLCFGYRGELYTLTPGHDPKRVPVAIAADTGDTTRTIPVTRGATDLAVSPSGKEVAFIYRGDVFVASVEAGTTRQITQTAGPERDVAFSPDGRTLVYAAERNGSWNIYRSDLKRKDDRYFFDAVLTGERPVVADPKVDTIRPRFSPDGKELAYLEERTTLKVLNLASHTSRTLLPGDRNFAYTDDDMTYRWSPDSRWLLVPLTNPDDYTSDVGLVSASGKEPVINLTVSGFEDGVIGWGAGGNMILFTSNRDGMRTFASTGGSQFDVYALFTSQKALDRFRLTKEELELLKEREKDAKKKEKSPENKQKDKKKEIKPIPMETKGLRERRVRLTPVSAGLAGAMVTHDGEKLLTLTRLEKTYDLRVTELREKKSRVLAKLGAHRCALVPGPKGDHVFVLADGGIIRVDIKSGKKKRVKLLGEMTIDGNGERRAMFAYVWRQIKKRFLDPKLHDTPWDRMRTEYEQYLPHINNNRDFAEMLSEMLGELNASHTGCRFYNHMKHSDQTPSLGLLFDPNWTGTGLKVAEVLEKGPMDRADSRVKPGVVLEKINGVLLTPAINPWRLLNRKAGEKVLLGFLDPDTKARWEETVKPVSSDTNLLYRRWVERNRKEVDRLSGGRLGYIHIRSMSDASFRTIYSEALGRYSNRDGLVVDTRFNGGGDLVDDLVTFLDGKRYMSFKPPRQKVVGRETHNKWVRPSIVIASEGNYSDAHCFPWAYHTLAIGKLVGMPVAGTCTFVWWERLWIPGLVYGIPNMAVEDPSGKPLENQQLMPDVRVEPKPGEVSRGVDPQLETAVQVLLHDIDHK